MSFEINRPSNNKPIIKETQSTHDGGGGNLGYMEGEGGHARSKKDEEELFAVKNEEFDTFKKDGEEDIPDEDFSIAKLIARIIFTMKSWAKKIFALK